MERSTARRSGRTTSAASRASSSTRATPTRPAPRPRPGWASSRAATALLYASGTGRRDGRPARVRCARNDRRARRGRVLRHLGADPAARAAGASRSSSSTRPGAAAGRRDRLGRVAGEPDPDPTGLGVAPRPSRADRLRRDGLDARLPAGARRGRRRRHPLGDEVPDRQPRRAARRDGHPRPRADRRGSGRSRTPTRESPPRRTRPARCSPASTRSSGGCGGAPTARPSSHGASTAHPAVERVRYPGFSGLISFDVADPRAVETRTRLITNATSLGGTRSTMESRHRWEGDRIPRGPAAALGRRSRTSTSSGPTSSRRSHEARDRVPHLRDAATGATTSTSPTGSRRSSATRGSSTGSCS